jgi:hypothetical protein
MTNPLMDFCIYKYMDKIMEEQYCIWFTYAAQDPDVHAGIEIG